MVVRITVERWPSESAGVTWEIPPRLCQRSRSNMCATLLSLPNLSAFSRSKVTNNSLIFYLSSLLEISCCMVVCWKFRAACYCMILWMDFGKEGNIQCCGHSIDGWEEKNSKPCLSVSLLIQRTSAFQSLKLKSALFLAMCNICCKDAVALLLSAVWWRVSLDLHS